MKLSRSMNCINCNEVFDKYKHGRCPKCGSAAIWPIGKWVTPRGIDPAVYERNERNYLQEKLFA